MKVFLFEFATCFGDLPPSVAVEGLGMFKSLYEGFVEFCDVVSFLGLDVDFDVLSFDCDDKFICHLERSDFALIIAPETDWQLLKLTRIVEEVGVPNLGSSSKAIEVTSDKWELYRRLKGKVRMPKTSLRPMDPPFIVKPRVGCGGEGIRIADRVPDGYIAQEFVKGIDLSVSLIVGDGADVLSVNRQIIESFRYAGAEVPYEMREDVIETAFRVVEAIKGLFGYVGVDVILSSEEVYVVDVNARITTPSILFRDVYGMNLARILVRNYEGKRGFEHAPKRRMRLRKVEGNRENAYVSYGGYSLIKEVLDG